MLTHNRPESQRETLAEVLKELQRLRAELRAPAKRLLTIRETAVYLGIAEKTLRNSCGRKAPKPFPVRPKRVAGRVVFDLRELEAYVDGLEVEV
jgi:hypothetical protein